MLLNVTVCDFESTGGRPRVAVWIVRGFPGIICEGRTPRRGARKSSSTFLESIAHADTLYSFCLATVSLRAQMDDVFRGTRELVRDYFHVVILVRTGGRWSDSFAQGIMNINRYKAACSPLTPSAGLWPEEVLIMGALAR